MLREALLRLPELARELEKPKAESRTVFSKLGKISYGLYVYHTIDTISLCWT